MSDPTLTPVPPSVSKRLATLLVALLATQVRRIGLAPEDVAMLYEIVDLLLVTGLSAHWLTPALRKALAKGKPKVESADERL
jgi:hypothetical protein